VTVTAPQYTHDPVQRIDMLLRVFAPELGGLSPAFGFVYSNVYSDVNEAFLTASYNITPQNVGSDMALHWEATTDSAWLNITPSSGTTPQSFTLTATGFDTTTVIAYSGWLTVTVTDPAYAYLSPQAIPVTLKVIDTPFHYVHLPVVLRNSAPY
jgi:hypothetical protein